MNQSQSRRKVLQLLSLTMLGSLSYPEIASADKRYFDYSDDPVDAIHIKKGEGKRGNIGGIEFISKLNKSQTNSHLACDEAILKPGHLGAPPHMHKTFDEICYVLEGTLNILVGEKVYEVSAGDWHLRPRNIIHTFWNSSASPVRFIDIYIPGGHEEYMAELAKLFENNGRPKKEDFALLEQKHDIIYSWDKLPEIMTKYKVHL